MMEFMLELTCLLAYSLTHLLTLLSLLTLGRPKLIFDSASADGWISPGDAEKGNRQKGNAKVSERN